LHHLLEIINEFILKVKEKFIFNKEKFKLSIDILNEIVYNSNCQEGTGKQSSPNRKEENKMSNPNMEAKVKELQELKRMKEELEAEITTMEDEIKKVMGDEETLFAGAFKVSWKSFTSNRLDTTALKKALPQIAEQFMKATTARRFSIN